MLNAFKLWLDKIWYRDVAAPAILIPLMYLYAFISKRRRKRFLNKPEQSYHSSAMIIIVGNINAGGTGKTPLTLGLAQILLKHGVNLALVSRGYGGKSNEYPLEVKADTDPALCGDEALIYANHLTCPVIVDPDRVRAVQYLEANHQPLLILSDDGLQHYKLQRDLEIVVVDGKRGLGNGKLIPCGPLREPAERLQEVDIIVVNGTSMTNLPTGDVPVFYLFLKTGLLFNLHTGEALDCMAFQQRFPGKVHAMAGMGNPERFFSTLTSAGFAIITHVFSDHHRYTAKEIDFGDAKPVVMTEKDAVKCRLFASEQHWYLCVDAILPEGLVPLILQKLAARQDAKQQTAQLNTAANVHKEVV